MKDLQEYRANGIDAPIELLVRSDEWRPLVEFVERWYRDPLSARPGATSAMLDRAEEQAGRRFPAAIREWYRLFASYHKEEAQDYEMPLTRVGGSSRWLQIFGENQDCWTCGVLEEHHELENPPIYFESYAVDVVEDWGLDPAELVDGRYLRVTDTFTEFVYGMAMRQAGIVLEPQNWMKPGVCGGIIQGNCDIPELQLPVRRVLKFPSGYDPWYDGKDLVIIEDFGFIARTRAAFERMVHALRQANGELKNAWQAE